MMDLDGNIQKVHCNELYQLFLAVGCIRVLSDLHFRSIIYDLAVLPEYQNKGIGKELVQRCMNACESSEWLVQTDMAKGFYEKIGFKENDDFFLTMNSKLNDFY